ncbi:hypothetical protein ATCC90586_011936 [Pythium insidiosum]|nr:hypothetical protein ATCC90586_011936 [Pythium insidiosum]
MIRLLLSVRQGKQYSYTSCNLCTFAGDLFLPQVELHGHYSLERLIDMTRYSDHVSFLRALFPIVMAVVPTIIMVSTIDLLPLEAPSLGLSHSRNFWIRSAFGTFCITVSALEVHHRLIPVLRLTLWQLLAWCVVITAGMTAGTIAMAHAIGFPLPFQFHIVNPRVMEEVQAFQVIFGTLTLCTFIYPAYNYAFVSLDGHAQAAFALLLPVVKLIVKNVVAPFCKHMEDMKPGEVIFNVEIFHALFTSYCMQVSRRLMKDMLSRTQILPTPMAEPADKHQGSTKLPADDKSFDLVHGNASEDPRHVLLKALTPEERLEYSRLVLNVLHVVEFVVLAEFTEVIIPVIYCTCIHHSCL